jgi:PST family polysaccharide transporter/lipopolysaccharide exporter
MTHDLSKKLAELIAKIKGGQTPKAKTARGAIWLTIGGGSEQSLRLIRTMILTRLLSREDFGVMGLVMAVNMWFESFTEVGIRLAVIQNPEGKQKTFLNGAWFLSVGRSLVLFTLAFLSAPYIGQFYGEEIVAPLRVAFLTILFSGAQSPNAYTQTKDLKYGRWSIVYNGGASIGILVAIVMGFIRPDIWALVIGFTAESASRCILSYILCPFLPTFEFDRKHLSDLFKYARGVFGLGFLAFLYKRLDILVLGRLVDKSTLGLYQVSLIWAQTPFMLYTTVIGPLLFPSFSAMQDNHPRLRSAILKSSKYLSLLYMPMLTLMICFAEPLVIFLAGEDYADAAAPFAFLCAAIGLQIFGQSLGEVCFATGKPELIRKIAVFRLVIAALLIVPMIEKYGLVGAANTRAIVSGVWILLTLYFLKKYVGLSFLSYPKAIAPGLAVGAAIAALYLALG